MRANRWFLAALCILAGCGGGADTGPPDVILVTIDTLRADRVGCYGHAPAQTPTLDRLALEGTRYDQCQAPVPVTLPSHATILTGLNPPRHGIRNNLTYELADGVPTLAEALHRRGYATGAFVAARPLLARFGLDRGFDVYDDRLPEPAGSASVMAERPATAVVDAALQWVRGQPTDQPIFLWVHFFEPHHPYAPPAPFADRFPDSPYDGEVAAADAGLGQLLGALDEARTGTRLTVVTADHGEGLGEHGEASHAVLLYQTTLRVPLIFHGPDWIPADAVVEEPVGLIDIAPTVLSLLGVDPREEFETDGIALVPGRVDPPRRDLYSETLYPLEGYGWSPSFALRHGDRKVIRSARSRAFALDEDPGETVDLLAEDAPGASAGETTDPGPGATPSAWGEILLGRLDSAVVALTQLAPQADAARLPTEKETEALAALGYVGGQSALVGGEGDDFLLRAIQGRADATDRLHELEAFTRAEVDIAQGRPLAVVAGLEPILRQNPENTWAHWLTGRALFEAGQTAAALPHFQVALSMRPRWLLAQLNIARLYRRLDQPDDAIREYEAAVALAPEDPALLEEAAGYLQQRGELVRASRLLERGLESSQMDEASQGRLHGHLARIHLQAGRLAQGREHLTAARRLSPSDSRLTILESLFLRQEGRWQEIVALLDDPSGELAGSGEAWLQLGVAQQMLGRVDAALAALQECVALADTLSLAQNNLAWLLATDKGRAQEALPHAIRAVNLAPAEPEYHDTYLEVLERLGQTENAKEHLRRVFPQFPSHRGLADRARRYGVGR